MEAGLRGADGFGLALLLIGCAAAPPDAAPVAAEERLVMPPALPARLAAVPPLAEWPAAAPLPARPAMPAVEVAASPPPDRPAAPASPPIPPPPAALPPAPMPAAVAEAPAPPPAPRREAPVPAGRGGGAQVQLVAAGTEAEARAHWAGFAQRLPDLAEGRSPQVIAFERPGQATIWRLRLGGFADAAEARAWCEALRARGGSCWVAG
jgi:hypothetical protein